jgi:hypothetical protein
VTNERRELSSRTVYRGQIVKIVSRYFARGEWRYGVVLPDDEIVNDVCDSDLGR